MTLAFLFDSVGFGEWFVLLAVVLIVVGPKRLPSAARTLGQYYSKFRRAADNVRLAQLATILCASNLGDKWSSEGTALIGINGDGCALNNRLFWDDFISHGHDNGRASLFVPTFPSIPVCEAAIALHIQGPVRYIAAESAALLDEAISDMFATDSALRQIMTVELFNRSVRCVLHI